MAAFLFGLKRGGTGGTGAKLSINLRHTPPVIWMGR